MKWIMAMVAVLALPALAFGAASITLTEHGGTGTSISVAQGGSVWIDVQIDFDDTAGCGGFNFGLREATGGIFDITDRNMPLGSFNAISPPPDMPWAVANAFNATNVGGAHTVSAWAHTGSDQVFLELEITAGAAATLATYTVDPGRTISAVPTSVSVYQSDGLTQDTPLTLAGIDITVTPEPASMLLLAGALPFLRRRRSA